MVVWDIENWVIVTRIVCGLVTDIGENSTGEFFRGDFANLRGI
jgi:hypothetical protein